MKIEIWPIDRPLDYPKNARKWSAEAIEKVAMSIRTYGWRQPVVVDSTGVIIIGHLRRAAGRKAGMTECPVHVATDLTPAQVRGLRIADNRLAREAEFDLDLLGPELMDLRDLGFDLNLTGFDIDEIADLTARKTVGLTDDDAAPPLPLAPVSILGDVWLLRSQDAARPPHRVLCGDATSPGTMQRLMNGKKVDLTFTDVPYNVAYEGYTEDRLTIQGDRMSGTEFRQFLEAVFGQCRAAMKSEGSLYVCHSSSWQREFQNALEAVGFELRCQIVWAKNTFAWGFGRYKFQHEPIFYCHILGQSDPWYGDKSQSTLWQENKPAANRLHPTAKPTALIERAIANSTKAGNYVLDPTAGSGSSLIACEKTGRIAYLVEIDPRYVDVIVTRWRDFTGREAIHEETGATFEHVKFGRRLAVQDAVREELLEVRE